MSELNATLTIAYRDTLKFLRDRARLVSTFVFPFIFIGIVGGSLQANLGEGAGYNFLTFTFTGVLAMTLFQSSAMGIISLIEDRESDFSQEIFVSPISRYSIILGKILGESIVALAQGIGIVGFALIIGVSISATQIAVLVPVAIATCLVGGAFGIIVLSNLGSQRAAQQIFPFIMLPQYFLSGIFNPIQVLPFYMDVLSRVSPMRYAVDLTRDVFYAGQAEYSQVVLNGLPHNVAVMFAMFISFFVGGTFLFVRGERNR